MLKNEFNYQRPHYMVYKNIIWKNDFPSIFLKQINLTRSSRQFTVLRSSMHSAIEPDTYLLFLFENYRVDLLTIWNLWTKNRMCGQRFKAPEIMKGEDDTTVKSEGFGHLIDSTCRGRFNEVFDILRTICHGWRVWQDFAYGQVIDSLCKAARIMAGRGLYISWGAKG